MRRSVQAVSETEGEGFDIKVLIGDRALNRALAASFYSNSGKGMTELVARGLEMEGALRLRLVDPPMMMSLDNDRVMATLGLEASAAVIGRRLEADVGVSAQIALASRTGMVEMTVERFEVDTISLGDMMKLPHAVTEVIEGAVRGFLQGSGRELMTREIPLPPIKMSIPLAGSKEEMELVMEKVHAIDGGIVIGLSAGPSSGSGGPLIDHASDVAVMVSGPFLLRMLDEMWDQLPHEFTTTKRTDVPDYRSILDIFVGAFDFLRTLGTRRERVRVDRSWVESSALIEYGHPELRLREGGFVEIANLPLHVVAQAVPKMEAAVWNPRNLWERLKAWLIPSIKEERREVETLELKQFSKDLNLRIDKAVAKLSINDKGELEVKATEVNLDLDLAWDLPEDISKDVANWILDQVVNRFPSFKVPLPLDQMVIPVLDVKPDIELKSIETQPGFLTIHADLHFPEVPISVRPLPRFVADLSRGEVHRPECRSTHLVPEQNKVGYYSLQDALMDGFRGCRRCLSMYQYWGAAVEGAPAPSVILEASRTDRRE